MAIRNVTVFGGTGGIGARIVKQLKDYNVQIISRSEGPGVIQSDFTDFSYLKDQDVVIIALAFMVGDVSTKIIDAAAAAGVKYVLPTEFGSDNANPSIRAIPANGEKSKYREQIEKLGMYWIGIVNNPWYDFVSDRIANKSLPDGYFSINPKERTATIFKGAGRFNTTMRDTTALAVARVLPLADQYRNKFVYINSFAVTQEEILESVKKVVGGEWTVTHGDIDEYINDGWEKLKVGDFSGMLSVLYGINMKEGAGGYYDPVDNAILELPQENLDDATKALLS